MSYRSDPLRVAPDSTGQKKARHGRHTGRITGGTECYGRHYPCNDPLTSQPTMFLNPVQVALHDC